MKNKPSIRASLRNYSDLEKIRKDLQDTNRKLDQGQHNLTQKENRLTHLENKERKKRNHRICYKGAHIEYLIPETEELTDDQFIEFCDALFSFPGIMTHIQNIIKKIKEEN